MSFLYVTKIYFLCLLKISYEVIIGLLFLTVLIGMISLTVGDKYYFLKKLNKLKEYIYGKL